MRRSPYCFLLPGGFHLCTIMWMKVSRKPQWTSVSLCHLPPCPSPSASSPSLLLLIRSAHTCGEPAALSNSRQRPQTGWLQITFKSKKKNMVGTELEGESSPSIARDCGACWQAAWLGICPGLASSQRLGPWASPVAWPSSIRRARK